MGPRRDPWFIEASPFNGTTYGAYPEFEFHHARGAENKEGLDFQVPSLSLPEGLSSQRMQRRLDVLESIELQQRALDKAASTRDFDRYRSAAVSLLTDNRVKSAFVRTQ